MAYFKAVKAGGVVLNVAGVLISAWDMKRNGINGNNVYSMGTSGLAFIPGVGWCTPIQAAINDAGNHAAMEMNS